MQLLHRNARGGPGERQEIARNSPWWTVHAARYKYAVHYARNRRILDVACGTGYGLAALDREARRVVGVDMATGAAKTALSQIGSETGAVLVADACELPFSDRNFDLIVSFETVEHLNERHRFLGELRRVLTREGLCLLSTPNALQSGTIDGRPLNPYHVHEYTPQEFEGELRQHFCSVRMLGQVLDSRFFIPPFLDAQEKLYQQRPMRKHIVLWRVLYRFPAVFRDRLSKSLWGHPFFPDVEDFHFSESDVETAPVLVAICHKTSPL